MSTQRGVLELDDYLSALDTERELFVVAIAAAGPDAPIPSCPEWTMRDLVHHQGDVHRWAAVIVGDRIAKPSAIPEDYLGPVPSDSELADWLGTGIDELIAVLRSAEPDMHCFTFLADPPRPVLFWARRQLHETGIHRVDAQCTGSHISAFSAPVAACGSVSRPNFASAWRSSVFIAFQSAPISVRKVLVAKSVGTSASPRDDTGSSTVCR